MNPWKPLNLDLSIIHWISLRGFTGWRVGVHLLFHPTYLGLRGFTEGGLGVYLNYSEPMKYQGNPTEARWQKETKKPSMDTGLVRILDHNIPIQIAGNTTKWNHNNIIPITHRKSVGVIIGVEPWINQRMMAVICKRSGKRSGKRVVKECKKSGVKTATSLVVTGL